MGLRDINISTNYETVEDSRYLVDEFYIPVLEQSTKYYRIAGFFSSSSLAIVAKGIEGLVNIVDFQHLSSLRSWQQTAHECICPSSRAPTGKRPQSERRSASGNWN